MLLCHSRLLKWPRRLNLVIPVACGGGGGGGREDERRLCNAVAIDMCGLVKGHQA